MEENEILLVPVGVLAINHHDFLVCIPIVRIDE